MNKRIKIELKSDLCSSSGNNFGSLIDTDICYDKYGLAYIPSKRLKGILKEAFIEYSDWIRNSENSKSLDDICSRLFGIEGANNSCDLIIDNAYLEDIDLIEHDIENIEDNYSKYLNKQRILNTISYVRYQTAIDEKTGVAKENSLRTIRVLKSGLVFYSNISVKGEDELDLIGNILPLVTHIGMNRTRGFGEVECTILDSQTNNSKVTFNFEEEKEYTIDLLLKAESNIMVSKQNSEISIDYIPGSNIMGAIANKYLRLNNIDFENMNNEFINLFLNGKVHYSNSYITEENGEIEYYPVPLSYTKVKNTNNRFHNKMYDVNEENIQLSNLSDEYVSLDENNFIKDVKLSEHYHHQRAKDLSVGHVSSAEDGGTFFQFSAIDMGQVFLSHITGKGKYLDKILNLLKINDIIRVGKSKTAEYGALRIKDIKVFEQNNVNLNANKFAVVLTSPVILFDEKNAKIGNDKKTLEETLINIFGAPDLKATKSFIGYSEESGYNAIWNLPKEQFSSYEKGTTIVFETNNDISLKENYCIGLRNNEGYGNIKVIKLQSNQNSVLELKKFNEIKQNISFKNLNMQTKNILKSSIKNAILEQIQKDVLYLSKEIKLNNTTIGRILLMLKQSKSVGEFLENVNAIKDVKKLQKVTSLIKNNERLKELEAYKDYSTLYDISKEENDELILEYIKQLFIILKIGGERND